MARVLVAEDDPDIAHLLVHSLAGAGHSVEIVANGAAVVPRVREDAPDLLILDLMLPGRHGLDICRELRADPTTARLPIIMVTARGDESDRISGLDLGADDYVAKPFSPKEVVARVGALLRRLRPPAGDQSVLQYAAICLDLQRHLVTDGEREVRLTAKEFLLLQYLIEHRGRVLSRDLLLTDVWGYRYTGGTRTVDVHVRRLREKIPFLLDAIVTITQFGYKLIDPPPGP
jgi:DNA-binding response OmpR family regulator